MRPPEGVLAYAAVAFRHEEACGYLAGIIPQEPSVCQRR